MSAAVGFALVLDPMDELAGAVGRVEDWLLFAECDSDGAEIALHAGATAAGAMSLALAEAAGAAPRLYALGGHLELAPLTVVPGDLGAAVAAVHRGLLAVPELRPPSGTLRALELLHRCAVCSRRADGAVLAVAVAPGPASVRFDVDGYRAYERFARAVLVDPLERFAALGSPSLLGTPDEPATPELGL